MFDVRIFVEWIFSEDWVFLDFKKNFKLCFSVVGKMYLGVILFRDVVICCYGS